MVDEPASPQPGAEAAAAPAEPAGLGVRALAKLFDSVVLAPVLVVVSWAAAFGAYGATLLAERAVEARLFFERDPVGLAILPLAALLWTLVVFGYYAASEGHGGRTVGKRIAGLSVRSTSGAAPSAAQARRRNGYHLALLLGVIPGLGWPLAVVVLLLAVVAVAATIAGDPARRQGWHDRRGQTVVVRSG